MNLLLLVVCVIIGYVMEPIFFSANEPIDSKTNKDIPMSAPIAESVNKADFSEILVKKKARSDLSKNMEWKQPVGIDENHELATVQDTQIPISPLAKEIKDISESEILALMKADISSGKVRELRQLKITSWKRGANLSYKGVNYTTGQVDFEMETILGIQIQKAIALIQEGKIYKWLWADTLVEMR